MSTLKVNTIQNTSGGSSSTPEQIEQGRAKCWMVWNGTGTVAILDSFNMSSLVDNGTGDYTLNFSITMGGTNFVFAGHCRESDSGGGNRSDRVIQPQRTPFTTTSARLGTHQSSSGNMTDNINNGACFFGD